MTNKQIANAFRKLASIMELHGENPFKIKSYSNAYINLRKLDRPLLEMSSEEISELKGIGKAITAKIGELIESGTLATYQKYAEETPPGIVDLLDIKGFGAKKIKTVWEGLGVETAGELLYACNENRLVELKGFGLKSQEDLKQKLKYFLSSQNKFHLASIFEISEVVIEAIKKCFPDARIELTGEVRRSENIVQALDLLVAGADSVDVLTDFNFEIKEKNKDGSHHLIFDQNIPVNIYLSSLEEFSANLFLSTGGINIEDFSDINMKSKTEAEIFKSSGRDYVLPELRGLSQSNFDSKVELIEENHILGVIHSHTTYSDGLNSLVEMANAARQMGYQYIGITDHSKSAFYANGLQEERLLNQIEEIEELNSNFDDFKILKGIESDILNNGDLDYPDEILAKLDFVIASVHSNLKMDEAKATVRLIKAVESPYTNILGHPTGRLLLSRQGYPIDHKKIIDACAANKVSIELNANPYRLDLDWKWIPYCIEKGVKISINPDAHSIEGIKHIKWGIYSARKGGLSKEMCLNAMDVDGFLAEFGTS